MSDKLRIYNPIKNRFVNVNQFGAAAKKLYKLYIDDLGTPAENVLPPGLKYNPETGYFTKTKQQKEKILYSSVKKYTYEKDFNNPLAQSRIPSIVKNIMKNYKGKSIKVITYWDGNVFNEGVVDIPNTYSSWWKKSGFMDSYIRLDSDTYIFSKVANLLDMFAEEGSEDFDKLKPTNKQGTLIIDILKKVDGEKYKQSFLDSPGLAHCFFTPIYEWADNCLEDSKSKTAIKRYKGYIKKINEYMIQYKDGIPQDELQSVCDKLQISIHIDLPNLFNKDATLLSCESNKKPLKIFKYINTRIDHLELNDCKSLDSYVEVADKYEMQQLEYTLNKNNNFYFYKYDKFGATKIYTHDKIYKLESKYEKVVAEFIQNNNLNDYKIDHLDNPSLSNFCLDAVKTNGTIDFVKSISRIKKDDCTHIDMRRAYTKSKDCPYYKGILGKITDYRLTDKIMGTGLYEIVNVIVNNPLLKKLNFIFNNQIYTNAELEYFKDNGVDFKIIGGCWGSTIDIDFGDGEEDDDLMYGRDGDGPRFYCKWFGCLILHDKYNRYKFKCNTETYAKLYTDIMENDDRVGCIYFNERTEYSDEYGVIEYEKRKVYHQAQIAAFITSYQRISILEQLKKIDYKNLVRVCVDGIYFKHQDITLDTNFNYKENKTFENKASKKYCIECDPEDYYEFCNTARTNNQYEFHKGAGGTGKTHHNLTDKGFNKILFVAPSWKLARRKQEDYGCDSTCFYHLLTEDPEIWRNLYRLYSVLVIDEVSMLSNHNKNRIINRFKDHKIIFCGDVNYQLDPVYSPFEYENNLIGNFKPEYIEYYFIDTNDNDKEIIMEKGHEIQFLDQSCINGNMKKRIVKIHTITHETMHRCKCPKLKHNLLLLRKIMSTRSIDRIRPDELECLIKNKLISKENIDYNMEDYIITNTHKKKDGYSEKYKDMKKYYVKQNSRDFCNGQIIFNEKPNGVSSEIRHGFTIHSLQGETAENKLFIDINGITSLKMLYTAISRVKYWNQLVFIK